MENVEDKFKIHAKFGGQVCEPCKMWRTGLGILENREKFHHIKRKSRFDRFETLNLQLNCLK